MYPSHICDQNAIEGQQNKINDNHNRNGIQVLHSIKSRIRKILHLIENQVLGLLLPFIIKCHQTLQIKREIILGNRNQLHEGHEHVGRYDSDDDGQMQNDL